MKPNTQNGQFLLALFIGLVLISCDPTDNPSCTDITVTLNSTSSGYKGTKTITDNISDDYKLESITITDSDGWDPESMILYAPANDDDMVCKFVYPANQGNDTYEGNSFAKSTAGGSTVFTAENVVQRIRVGTWDGDALEYTYLTPDYCPVEKHMGNWTLEVLYSSSVAGGTLVSKDLEICYKWEE